MRIARIQLPGSAPRAALEQDGKLYALGTDDVDALFAGKPPGAPQAAVKGAAELAPVIPSKIVAIGLNYLDHIREAGLQVPERPLVFAKFPSSIIGPGASIEVPRNLTQRVDWEVELGVVIGARARRVAPERALAHVYGYTVANDVSARDLQLGDGQWVRGKSLDGFCPVGPVVVTADELPDPGDLRLVTRVNGDTVQDASTKEMVFGVAELISFCSQHFTLHPGDLILTGTPWGCGEFANPPRHLLDGDIVECEIEGIGTLRNPVRDLAPAQ